MKVFTALTAILFVSSCSADLNSEYDHYAALDESENFKLYWTVNRDEREVSFAVDVRTTGWVGFGISSGKGQMTGSDLVIGWVKDGKGYLTDRYADGYSVPVLDKQQDYKLTESMEKGGKTVLKFKRKLDTCDERDRKIEDGTSKVVFAYHTDDPEDPMKLQKHSVKGQRSLMLLNFFKGSSSHEGLKYFDVLNTEVHLPSNDTTYWCQTIKLPKFEKKQHIVKIVPVINKGHEGLVHHILIYLCDPKRFNESVALNQSNTCQHPNMPKDARRCRRGTIIGAWAIGQKEFSFPLQTGLPVGTADGPKIVLLETHYDNPLKKSGLVDSSGLRFYYAAPRKYDAGVMMVGCAVADLMIIPPRETAWTTSGYCAKECTQAALPQSSPGGGGVNVFGVLLHTHLAGRKIRLRHIRNGKELPELARDDHYDFNFQETQHLKKLVKFLPGDELINECVYDTMDRTHRTKGGEASKEEMCLSFVYYYPSVHMTNCLSMDHGYYYWLHNYGLRNFTHADQYFPMKWNKSMANDLKNMYNFAPNMTMICAGPQLQHFADVPKPKILVPLPEDKGCGHGVSSARGLETSVVLAMVMAFMVLVIK